MLRSFLPLFLMTFFICLFIVLMQFLWRYIDDLVGKGLEIHVLGELFFYAALTMVPMALPLAILLASLMTFGNLGERFELTAMKASGVSLVKVMRPLIVFIALVAVGAFFFQNYVLPIAQTKMWTLLYSVRQKSPEVEIPEGVFYDQIPGYNLYVESKNPETGTLFDMMIYDVSRGFDNTRVILADSGHLKMADDKAHLFLQLYDGEQFENLRDNNGGGTTSTGAYQPYRRETFKTKEILVAFDANFNRMDESGMRNQYVGKNIEELQATIDSVTLRVDSIGNSIGTSIKEYPYAGISYYKMDYSNPENPKTVRKPVALDKPIDIDSVFYKEKPSMTRSYLAQALSKARQMKQDYEFQSYTMADDKKTIRRHGIEMHKKFTLSFACLIFFFIGAPLGAIIRKGGIGTPLVISVFLFIFYYIIDNTGYKMARDGKVEVWEGIWLSSFVLLPLGVFFTYKAVRDSAVFNFDAYKLFILRLRGKLRRELEVKDFTMTEVEPRTALEVLRKLDLATVELTEAYRRLPFYKRWYYMLKRFPQRDAAQTALNETVDYLSNTRERQVIQLVNLYPFQLTVRNAESVRRATSSLEALFKKQLETQTTSE